MTTTVGDIAEALGISARWVRKLFGRGMPSDLNDPEIIAKCKRWHAGNVDSHRGGWESRGGGKRHQTDERQDELLRVTVENMEEDLRRLRAENDAKEAGMLPAESVARIMYDQVRKLEDSLPDLIDELTTTTQELVGVDDIAVRKMIEERIRSANMVFLDDEICGKTVRQWAEEGKALQEHQEIESNQAP